MSSRTNTARWSEKDKRWKINVQKNGKRRSFYSSTPGRTGQREANKKADEWLESGVAASNTRIDALYEQFKAAASETVGTSFKRQIDYFGQAWILPALGKKKYLPSVTRIFRVFWTRPQLPACQRKLFRVSMA